MSHPLDDLLPEICQLLDACREDFMQRGLWTEWDQSVRDRITAYNLAKLKRHNAPWPTDAMVNAALSAACLHSTQESRKDMRKALVAAALCGNDAETDVEMKEKRP